MSEEILARAEALLLDMMGSSAEGRGLAATYFSSLKEHHTPEEVLAIAERLSLELERRSPRKPPEEEDDEDDDDDDF
ncbi:MAG TPA: hypothetical protein VGH73_15660 [Thermoanaerobaculia bacterium]|jgi:hypothetical protein